MFVPDSKLGGITDNLTSPKAKEIRDAINHLLLCQITPVGKEVILTRGVVIDSSKDFRKVFNYLKPIVKVIGSTKQPKKGLLWPNPFPPQTMISILEKGLGVNLFRSLSCFLDIPEKELARIVKIPISTLAHRKRKGYLTSTVSERLYRILNLYKKAVEVFDNNPEYAKKWLKEEAYGLGGEIPLEFAKTELGAKEVELLLMQIDEGIFV